MPEMRPTRITEYFPPVAKAVNQKRLFRFLDLPAFIRYRIYAELVINSDSDETDGNVKILNWPSVWEEVTCIWEPSESPLRPPTYCRKCGGDLSGLSNRFGSCECGRFPIELFLVCKAITDEVVSLFYSKTHFQLVCNGPGETSILKGLSPKAIASMRHLTIWMNRSFCGPGCRNHYLECHATCKYPGHDEPIGLRAGSQRDRSLVVNFRRLCQHLARYITPSRLSLTLVGECKSPQLRNDILCSLRLLPTLSHCAISLVREPDAHIRQVEQEVCQELTAPVIKTPFPFRHLPKELQLEILQYLGLVHPGRFWYEARLNQISHDTAIGRRSPDGRHHTCFYLSESLGRSKLCCCRCRTHSIKTPGCTNKMPSNALFLVDREMNRDARWIMHQGNRWTLNSFELTVRSARSDAEIGNMKGFLRDVRDLAFMTRPELPPGDPWTEDDGGSSWPLRISYIWSLAFCCQVEQLTFTWMLPHPPHFLCLSMAVKVKAWAPNCRRVNALVRALGGRRFKDFFVHIAKSTYESKYMTCPCRHGDPYMPQRERWFERQISMCSLRFLFSSSSHLSASHHV